MSDPRVAAADRFTATQHSEVPPGLEPHRTTLAPGFTVCIIGASSGIGEHIAYAYASASATNIVLASRDETALARVAAHVTRLNAAANTAIHRCNVADAASVAGLAGFIGAAHGRLDAVVLASGYAGPVTLRVDAGRAEWVQRAFDTNAMGTYHVAHHLVPLLMAGDGDARGARLFVVTGSIAGCIRRGPIANTGYCVSKMAQARLIEFLDEQFGAEGLMAVCLHPGAVLTPMAEGNTPEEFMPYLTDSVDLAGAVCVWLTAQREQLQWISGRLISATWDMGELVAMKDAVVSKDLLKFALQTA